MPKGMFCMDKVVIKKEQSDTIAADIWIVEFLVL